MKYEQLYALTTVETVSPTVVVVMVILRTHQDANPSLGKMVWEHFCYIFVRRHLAILADRGA